MSVTRIPLKVSPTTTVEELLQGGFTLTTPDGFEVRGRPDDSSITMRQPTPAGLTSAGHLPLCAMGVYVACGDMTEYAQMCAREDAREAAEAAALQTPAT